MEESFPDFLYNVTKSLKAGVSIEQAMHDVAKTRKDALSREIVKSFGIKNSFKEAMSFFSENIKSSIIRLCIFLLLTLKEKDVSLSDVLGRISDELWAFYSLYKERDKKIGSLALLVFISGVVLIPFTVAILVFIMQTLPDVVSVQIFLLVLPAITTTFYWSITDKSHFLLLIPICILVSGLTFILTLKIYSLGLPQLSILSYKTS